MKRTSTGPGGVRDCALISRMFWSVYVPPRWYFQCVAVCKCMFVWKHASGLLLQGVRCGGTSCIIDASPRFAHVAPPGDGVPGGEVPERGEAGQQAGTGGFKYFSGPFSFI